MSWEKNNVSCSIFFICVVFCVDQKMSISMISIHKRQPHEHRPHLSGEREEKNFIFPELMIFEQLLQNLKEIQMCCLKAETSHSEQVIEPLSLSRTFIFPLYIGSDNASNASSLHLCTKSGNFWKTFWQIAFKYISCKKLAALEKQNVYELMESGDNHH